MDEQPRSKWRGPHRGQYHVPALSVNRADGQYYARTKDIRARWGLPILALCLTHAHHANTTTPIKVTKTGTWINTRLLQTIAKHPDTLGRGLAANKLEDIKQATAAGIQRWVQVHGIISRLRTLRPQETTNQENETDLESENY